MKKWEITKEIDENHVKSSDGKEITDIPSEKINHDYKTIEQERELKEAKYEPINKDYDFKEEWEEILIKWIKEVPEEKVSSEKKEKLVEIIKKYHDVREDYKWYFYLKHEKEDISEDERELLEDLTEKFKETEEQEIEMFKELNVFRHFYDYNKERWYDSVINSRKEKYPELLAEKLSRLKYEEYNEKKDPQHQEFQELSAEINNENYEQLKERYKRESGGRAIYRDKETKGFKSWRERLNERQEEIHEEISEDSHEIKEEWADSLKNHIYDVSDEEVSEDIKEELTYVIENYDTLKKIVKKLPPNFRNLIEDLRQFQATYDVYKERGYEKSNPREVSKVIKKLKKRLELIKNEAVLNAILNKENLSIQNFKENLKENLYKSTILSINEKSKIIKIIQKEKLMEQDKDVLISKFSKYPPKELKLLLGNDFQSLFLKKDIQKYNQIINMSSGYNPPEKRIKVRKVVLKIIQNELKNRGFTIVDIDSKIGYCFKNALYYGLTFSLKDFNRLKELVGPENLFKIFKINDIPHKIMIGKSLQERINLEESDDVAKLVAILVGDGHLSENGADISISFNGVDQSYYVEYTKKLLRKIFKDVHIQEKWDRDAPNASGKEKGLTLTITSISIHESLVAKGLIPGDKIKNKIKVPRWIFKKRSYKLSCLKELFDTDGSIFIDKNHKTINLNFTSASKPLVQDFYKICNQLSIKPSPKIVKRKVDESKYNPRFQLNITAKDQVRKFLELIEPKKFKDPYRRLYLGTQLIYLSKSKEIIDAIEKRIKKKFPRESERTFSKDFAIFLKKICEDLLGFKIKKEDIDKAIDNSLTYEICIYRKEKAKYFKYLYEQMGNLEYVKEYLIEQGEDVIPTDDTINNFIKQYIKTEENNLNYDNWLSKFRSRTINVDKRTNNINRFPRKQRSIINSLIFQILNETSKNLSNSEILELLIEKLKKSNMILIPWLIKNKKYSAALKKYINNLITLIKEIFISMKRNKNIGGKFLKEKLQLPFSVSRINEMIRDLKEKLNIKY